MILNQNVSLYSAANAQYSGFGSFIATSYLSTPVTPPAFTAGEVAIVMDNWNEMNVGFDVHMI